MSKQTSIEEAYIGLDLHSSKSVFGVVDAHGHDYCKHRLRTQPNSMNQWLKDLPAQHKYLVVEEGPLTQWMSWQLAGQVDELVVCDPKQNYWIAHAANKKDRVDTSKLARLLRLDELHIVWHPKTKNQRALFAEAGGHYIKMRSHQVRLKQQIKSLYRRWGVLEVDGETLYSRQGRGVYLRQVDGQVIRSQLENFYRMMDQAEEAQASAEAELYRIGKAYPEIVEFQNLPGVGPIGSHLFDGLVQTPHRFPTASKLWRWSKLGVTNRSSNGKPLGYRRLDPNGRSAIKDMSYRAWKGALQCNEPNEVKCFFQASLERTGNRVHARLNTQRKILNVLWTIWKNDLSYDPTKF